MKDSNFNFHVALQVTGANLSSEIYRNGSTAHAVLEPTQDIDDETRSSSHWVGSRKRVLPKQTKLTRQL